MGTALWARARRLWMYMHGHGLRGGEGNPNRNTRCIKRTSDSHRPIGVPETQALISRPDPHNQSHTQAHLDHKYRWCTRLRFHWLGGAWVVYTRLRRRSHVRCATWDGPKSRASASRLRPRPPALPHDVWSNWPSSAFPAAGVRANGSAKTTGPHEYRSRALPDAAVVTLRIGQEAYNMQEGYTYVAPSSFTNYIYQLPMFYNHSWVHRQVHYKWGTYNILKEQKYRYLAMLFVWIDINKNSIT